jgi:hypothetical protein
VIKEDRPKIIPWGVADERSTKRTTSSFLDRIARLTAGPNPAPAELRELYNSDHRLPVPAQRPKLRPARRTATRRLTPQPQSPTGSRQLRRLTSSRSQPAPAAALTG